MPATRVRSPMVAATLLAVALLATAAPAGAPAAHADHHDDGGDERPVDEAPDQLSEDEDNADPQSKESCQDVRSEAGSIVIRRLIDGPRLPDGSLAFRSGVCIYVPPGYEDGTTRYPVLYLLHGAFGWQEDWFVQGDAQAILDAAYERDPDNAMIVVAPDGTYDANWKDDPSGYPLNETYVFDHVIPYVDTYLRTIPDRRGRAMSGLSNGGAGTLRLAAHHPDEFAVVTAMSAALPVNRAADRTNVRAVHNDPTEVADNLELVDLALIYGLEPCEPSDPQVCTTYGFAWGFENACCSNEEYNARLEMVRERPYTFQRVVGGHDWSYWSLWLAEEHGPFIRERLADPMPADAPLAAPEAPEAFDFRTIDPTFEIHGYTVTTDPDRAREYLTLTDVAAGGLTIEGSGTTIVETAARYVPGATYTVAGHGAEPVDVTADGDGRLTFPVDLGPAHEQDQYTPEQAAAEAAASGGYWVSRQITIESEGTSP